MAMSPSPAITDVTQGYCHFYLAPPYFKLSGSSSADEARLIKAFRNADSLNELEYAPMWSHETCLTNFRLPPFPFMKLPVAVRHMIYKILLAPLAEDHSTRYFKEEFPHLKMGQGLRFEVYDTDYNELVPGIDYGDNIITAAKEGAFKIPNIYQAPRPAPWSADVGGYFQELDQDSSEDSAEVS